MMGSKEATTAMDQALKRGEREKQMELLVRLLNVLCVNCLVSYPDTSIYILICADLLLLYCIVLMLLMSVQLQKAKREKDKAVRIIVHLVGKVSHCLCSTVAVVVVVDSRTVVVVM